ncbi:hypothetical protein [Chondromyces crocatus]|nr:hypothetical protein [Chondromyces crocatus]
MLGGIHACSLDWVGESLRDDFPSGCKSYCSCWHCEPDWFDRCREEELSIRGAAEEHGCQHIVRDYYQCIASRVCEEGLKGFGACPRLEPEVLQCASDFCFTHHDGVCDEPGGTGRCQPGSDSYDCGYCPGENDGRCDRTCPPGTDLADCTCDYENNGVCDGPEGTGLCAHETDIDDCVCPTRNDGICDERLGTGSCSDGTDVEDCEACSMAGTDCETCQACARRFVCAEEAEDCRTGRVCSEYDACVTACEPSCASDPWPENCLAACVSGSLGCLGRHPDAPAAQLALTSCLDTACAAQCSGAP